jgi:hypothetical protein
MIDIVGFLEGKTPDHRGRMLSMLWKQTDDDAENTHDYIQWMFPLDEPSRSVTGAPVLNELDIEDIRHSELARQNLVKSASWFLGFLERNDHWITEYDHNHLRITRVIKSLRLLASDEAADEFRDKVIALAGDNLNLVDEEARDFWNSA